VDGQRLSATVVIAGSAAFLVAAALPVSMRVFPEPSPERKLRHIEASPTGWTVSQVLFGVGAVMAVAGIALLARELEGAASSFGWISAAMLLLAALPWIWHLYARAVDPATFAAGSLPMWPLAVYFLLTEAGLAVYGIALLTSGLPPSVGWMVIGSMAVLFALTLITRDMVPAVYYLLTLLTGVMLYR
jgi:hypothetical protein